MSVIEELQHAETAIPADIVREWGERSDDMVVLRFPAQDRDGFDVEIHAFPHALTVYADLAHAEVEEALPPGELVREALKRVQDLLSSRTRLRIRFAGGVPYRWRVEVLEDGEWQLDFMTALLFWNYLGRRSEVIRQNRSVALDRRDP
jgi:hypothetical protein